ncbi:MAG: SufD family Fe-S cluster assembly protein [Clostridiales bacterium]|nr:SufD family Fe-S cluster assembly protein [Clostridiales bacterium]
MSEIINRPIVNTFGRFGANGVKVELPSDIKVSELIVEEGQSRIVTLEDVSYKLNATVKAGGTLELVQLHEDESLLINDVKVTCEKGATFKWYRAILGGSGEASSYDNCSVYLNGDDSSFEAYVGYRLGGKENYDGNVEAIHYGKNTESKITASGVLADDARKMLKSTIDFRTGCKGAVGEETEDVLLMNETVRNRSVPMILCGEEDVQGEHGATIGRLDENLVYYLESRGMEHEKVYEMMAEAKLNTVLRRIPDHELE